MARLWMAGPFVWMRQAKVVDVQEAVASEEVPEVGVEDMVEATVVAEGEVGVITREAVEDMAAVVVTEAMETGAMEVETEAMVVVETGVMAAVVDTGVVVAVVEDTPPAAVDTGTIVRGQGGYGDRSGGSYRDGYDSYAAQ
ncbi:cold inducible RNA binding protein a isoform 5-T6 [Aplochiton taeniatus]